ncbi:MAG: FAD-dependent oxidoreductase [Leptospiraceae bacterium]|nr:FAD-dependent oxidoreductase [Leptospiraceae bacterium]
MQLKTSETDFIVIGAGYGGVTSAGLLQNRGFNVKLLEAHSLIGGCASYFKRKNFLFDVGATTFSGILSHQPLGRLFRELNINPELIKIEPGMIIQMGSKKIIRYSNPNQWVNELNRHFPIQGIDRFWKRVFTLDRLSWEFISQNQKIPPRNLMDVFSLLKFSNLNKVSLLPNIFRSVDSVLNSMNIYNQEFRKFLDEQLLITTQSRADVAPMLTAAMGLAYPAETYYPMGGMYKPAELILEKFKELGGELILKEKVIRISQKNDGYEVETKKGITYFSKGIISNIPIWNLAEITEGNIQKYFLKKAKKYPEAPGAFTVNFAVESKVSLDSLYFQIHTRAKIPYCEAGAFFVSFSHLSDRNKSPEGFRTVTISTHTNPNEWIGLSKENYNQKKEITCKFILSEFDYAFPELSEANKIFPLAGTPDTFEYYTHRKNGFVGGIAHSVHSNLLLMTPNISPFPNFYLAGDTVFPGQGIPAVTLGALNLVSQIP